MELLDRIQPVYTMNLFKESRNVVIAIFARREVWMSWGGDFVEKFRSLGLLRRKTLFRRQDYLRIFYFGTWLVFYCAYGCIESNFGVRSNVTYKLVSSRPVSIFKVIRTIFSK
jgi:hypothetical protein